MAQISIIGAGSVVFTGRLVVDLCLTKGLYDSEVVLMDIDRQRLDMIYNLACRYAQETNATFKFKKTLDRKEALEGADFVINTVKIGGYEGMEIERKIAAKYGFYGGLGERVSDYYGGIGAYHQLKFFLELARDVEDNCPDAWLIQAANPLFEGVTLMSRETKAKVVGVCHGHYGYKDVVKTLGLNEEKVNVRMVGFNHNIWLTHFTCNGEDAYPILDKWIEEKAEEYWMSEKYLKSLPWEAERMSPAAIDMYKMFGLLPIGDTVRSASPWWYHLNLETKQKWFGPTGGFDSEIGWPMYLNSLKEALAGLNIWDSNPTIPLTKVYPPIFSGEQHIPLIEAITNNKETMLQLNIPNKGAIFGIPDDVVVEAPTLVDKSGIRFMQVDSLPKRVMVHNMMPRMLKMEQILQAFLEGDRRSLLLMTAEDHRTRTFEDVKSAIDAILGQDWNSEAAEHYKW
jgi:alpha-galactosidase